MTDKENQEQTPQGSSAETEKTENNQEERVVPKERFNQVNEAKKELETKLKALEAEKADREKKELEEKQQFKELYEKTQNELKAKELEIVKRDLIQEAITSNKLHPKLSKMVIGNTEEEIKASLEEAKAYHQEIQESIQDDHTASDNTGTGKGKKKGEMSTEEWMRLYEKDPAEADRILKEETEASNK